MNSKPGTETLLMIEVANAKKALAQYRKGTQSGRIYAYVIFFSLVAGSIIGFSEMGSKMLWLSILAFGMLYICIISLPSWRKNLPKLESAINEFELTAKVCENRQHIEQIFELRKTIDQLLKKANYPSPFTKNFDSILKLLSDE